MFSPGFSVTDCCIDSFSKRRGNCLSVFPFLLEIQSIYLRVGVGNYKETFVRLFIDVLFIYFNLQITFLIINTVLEVMDRRLEFCRRSRRQFPSFF